MITARADPAVILRALDPSSSSTAVRLAVMLAAGLLTRQAVLPLGRRFARGSQRRIPPLVSYAVAGILAALTRAALAAWAGLSGVPLWLAFGAVWGIVAGLLLPFGRPGKSGV